MDAPTEPQFSTVPLLFVARHNQQPPPLVYVSTTQTLFTASLPRMASKTRRGSSLAKKEKEIKKEIEEDKEVAPIQEEDDDGPPPILEREASCGENDDTDGDGKEEDAQKEDDIDGSKTKNESILEALSQFFTADDATVKNRRNSPPSESSSTRNTLGLNRGGAIPKALLLNKNLRPVPSKTPPIATTRFASLRHLSSAPGTSASTSGSPSVGIRKYGVPPPMPRSLRNIAGSINVVGSNSSLGPARLLESRKRHFDKDKDGKNPKRSSLVAYNGGRAGENFRKVPPSAVSPAPGSGSSASSGTSTSSSNGIIDVQSMLRDQSPVRMQVMVGGDHETNGDSIQEAMELANAQKESIGNIARASSHHNMLLGSMIINGLNTLQSRDKDEYTNFSSDLFSLITRYNIN